MRTLPGFVVALLMLLAPYTAQAGDEGETLQMAKDAIAALTSAAKAEDIKAFTPQCKVARELHNGMESQKMRGAIQKALGDVVKGKGPDALKEQALDTLATLDDADGVYKQVRGLFPKDRDTKASDLSLRAIQVVGKVASPAAVRSLRVLAKGAKAMPVRIAAITALGNYRPAEKQRVKIFRALLDLLAGNTPEADLAADDPQHEVWAALEGPLVSALGELTYLDHDSGEAWLAWNKKHGRKLGVVFDD